MSSPAMKTYHVVWEIDLDAESPRDAALEARKVHQDPGSLAVVFDVYDEDGEVKRVDLAEPE